MSQPICFIHQLWHKMEATGLMWELIENEAELEGKSKLIVNLQNRNQSLEANISSVMKDRDCLDNDGEKRVGMIEKLKDEITTLQRDYQIVIDEKARAEIFLEDEKKKVYVIQKQIDALNIELGKSRGKAIELELSSKRLHDLLNETLSNRSQGQFNIAPLTEEDQMAQEDVMIYHDSLFKHIKDGIMKNENLKVGMLFSPLLSDVLNNVKKLATKPRIVVVHAGTNDLVKTDEDTMLKIVKDIHTILHNRNIKMVYSFVTPRYDSPELNAKAQVHNARVAQLIGGEADVTVARNECFYKRGMIDTALFDDDGIHINEMGTKSLAFNTKDAICCGLGIELKVRDAYPRRGRDRGRGRGVGRGRGW